MSSFPPFEAGRKRLLEEVGRSLALKFPPFRRLYEENAMLAAQIQAYQGEVDSQGIQLDRLRDEVNTYCTDIEKLKSQIENLKRVSITIDKVQVEVLDDPKFQEACELASGLTLLDIPRLANIWQLSRMSNPDGSVAELGVFRGGCSLFMALAVPNRHLFLCDTFAGFGDMTIDPLLDSLFNRKDFDNTSADLVSTAMSKVTTNYELIRGYFPASDVDNHIRDISFAHIDLDLYESTLSSLRYLADRAVDRSIFVLDDFKRGAAGVMQAVSEFLASDNRFVAFPIFPGQGVMLHRSWWRNG